MDGFSMSEELLNAWLRLGALEWSPKRIYALLRAFSEDPLSIFADDEAIWHERLPELTEKQRAQLTAARQRDLTKDHAILARYRASVVPYTDPCYPSNLRELPDAPPVLYVRGSLVPDDKFSIAIVGSRRASTYGLSLSRRFARDLADHSLTVISGGARGVDTLAHRGALDASGRTIAFLGCGLDVGYPADNRRLFEEIADGHGAVVSEFPFGTTPEPWRFPARNRLISGTSLGVLVIESPKDSGSLITAREAADQGRDVFAIPGPIDSDRNVGCHDLIKDGAKLVDKVDDILNELGIFALQSPAAQDTAAPPRFANAPNLPPEQRQILEMLTLQPRHVDQIIAESALTAPQVTGVLTLLEMRGLARRVPGNAFVRIL